MKLSNFSGLEEAKAYCKIGTSTIATYSERQSIYLNHKKKQQKLLHIVSVIQTLYFCHTTLNDQKIYINLDIATCNEYVEYRWLHCSLTSVCQIFEWSAKGLNPSIATEDKKGHIALW